MGTEKELKALLDVDLHISINVNMLNTAKGCEIAKKIPLS
jgi:Tat protein secretion system quality control protein TatD with DNase activity